MRRREFLGALSSAAAAWPFAARAQQPVMPVIGALEAINSVSTTVDAFHQGLGDAGFTEGQNVTIERRLAEGHYERLPALAAELVGRQVTVIAATTPVAALAAKAATGTIPIVFSLGSDPVKDGLVASLNRPGGNITGVTFFNNLLAAKRIELLRDIVPGLSVVGLLLNPANPNAELELNDTEVGARSLGLKLVTVRAATSDQVDAAFAELVRLQATALTIAGDAYLTSRHDQTLALASQHRIATVHSNRESVAAGGLASYGADRREAARQFGRYIGRVIKGEKPANLPVVQPSKFEMVINLKTAKALDLTISRELLLRADEVIE